MSEQWRIRIFWGTWRLFWSALVVLGFLFGGDYVVGAVVGAVFAVAIQTETRWRELNPDLDGAPGDSPAAPAAPETKEGRDGEL